jgi:prepilin peptidase CpaA
VNVVKTLSFTFIEYYLVLILIVCAVIDCYINKIPNLLTYPTIIFALAYNSFYHGIDGLLFSIAGLFLGIIILGILYIFGVMGAGDVKLMGAVGAVFGPKNALNAFIFTGIIGGIYAMIVLVFRYKTSRKLFNRTITMLKTLFVTGNFVSIPAAEEEKPAKLCYGIAIALGALITIWLRAANYNLPI